MTIKLAGTVQINIPAGIMACNFIFEGEQSKALAREMALTWARDRLNQALADSSIPVHFSGVGAELLLDS